MPNCGNRMSGTSVRSIRKLAVAVAVSVYPAAVPEMARSSSVQGRPALSAKAEYPVIWQELSPTRYPATRSLGASSAAQAWSAALICAEEAAVGALVGIAASARTASGTTSRAAARCLVVAWIVLVLTVFGSPAWVGTRGTGGSPGGGAGAGGAWSGTGLRSRGYESRGHPGAARTRWSAGRGGRSAAVLPGRGRGAGL